MDYQEQNSTRLSRRQRYLMTIMLESLPAQDLTLAGYVTEN